MRTLGRDDLVLCSGTVRRLGVVETARLAAATGYQGISVYGHEIRRAVTEGWTLEAVRGLLDDLGLAVAEVDGAVDWVPGVALGDRASTVEETVDAARRLGARSISVVEISGGRIGDGLTIDQLADGFGRFCDLAAPHGVLVHIEYFPFSGITDLATSLEVVHAAARPNGGVLVDTWHHERGPDEGELSRLTAAAASVLGIQFNDAAIDASADVRHECMHERMLPGEGRATSAAMVAALRAGGCVAPVGVEVYSDALDLLDAGEAARIALDATRAALVARA
jgi:sugar phosphate isomerase/epimerase